MASYGFGLHHFLVHRCRFLGVYPACPFGYRSKAAQASDDELGETSCSFLLGGSAPCCSESCRDRIYFSVAL